MAALQERSRVDANALVQSVQANWKQPKVLKAQLEHWVSKSPPLVEALFATVSGGGQGAVLGGMMGQISSMDPNQANKAVAGSPEVARQMSALQQGGPWIQARNFAVFSGVSAGISVAMRRIRGKEDIRNTMVAGFGSGAAFALISGMAGAKPLQGAFSSGVLMALAQGAFYKIGQSFSNRTKAEPSVEYMRARHMLDTLGMSKYAKNLQKAQLNDSTIWLWNDSALREARIPAGPRLVLMHHVDRYRNLLKPNMPMPGAPPNQRYPPPSPDQSKQRK